jgi:hypothetical protein
MTSESPALIALAPEKAGTAVAGRQQSVSISAGADYSIHRCRHGSDDSIIDPFFLQDFDDIKE